MWSLYVQTPSLKSQIHGSNARRPDLHTHARTPAHACTHTHTYTSRTLNQIITFAKSVQKSVIWYEVRKNQIWSNSFPAYLTGRQSSKKWGIDWEMTSLGNNPFQMFYLPFARLNGVREFSTVDPHSLLLLHQVFGRCCGIRSTYGIISVMTKHDTDTCCH